MIVLSLLGTGLRYGFEMEDFARRTDLRQWAKIGMSTIYKALKELEIEGAVRVEIEESDRGPARKAYTLTPDGGARMRLLIEQALASDMPVYSARIAGLVFAPLMKPEVARQAIATAIQGLERTDLELEAKLATEGGDAIGATIIEYYRSIYAAERQAMRRIVKLIHEPSARRRVPRTE